MRISDGKKNAGHAGYDKKRSGVDNCLKFKSVIFDNSYDSSPTRLPLPQIAFCGRSNVGKSSLINAVLSRKIAYISKNPGKTVLINTFLVNENFYLVDLPGYGYARRSKEMRNKWKQIIEEYLQFSNMLFHIFVLIDARHMPLKSDMEFIRWLKFYDKSFSVVFTKTDKSNQKNISESIKFLEKEYGKITYFLTSSKQKKGLNKLCEFIFEKINIV